MAEDVDNQEEQETEATSVPAYASSAFSPAKIVEWLLVNLIPIMASVVLSTLIAIMIVRLSLAKRSEERLVSVQLTEKPRPLTSYDVGEFKINTADLNATHFVRVKLSLGYDAKNKALQTELIARLPQVRDLILNILNSKEKADIEERYQKDRLKQEILNSINNILNSGKVEAVYYEEFVIS